MGERIEFREDITFTIKEDDGIIIVKGFCMPFHSVGERSIPSQITKVLEFANSQGYRGVNTIDFKVASRISEKNPPYFKYTMSLQTRK